MRAAAALLALAACAGPDVPDQPYVFLYETPDAPIDASILGGAAAWDELGFRVGGEIPASDVPECGLEWHRAGEVECVVSIGVYFTVHARAECGGAPSCVPGDRGPHFRGFEVDPAVAAPIMLDLIGAHETGHVLLDTDRHTATGIMSATTDVLSDDDRELACETIGVCL